MSLDCFSQYAIGERIIDAACAVGNVSYLQLISKEKTAFLNNLRGVCCLIAWERGVHARRFSNLIHRTRGCVLNMTKRNLTLKRAHDNLTVETYNLITNYLNSTENGKV